jgi:hypothetical protein
VREAVEDKLFQLDAIIGGRGDKNALGVYTPNLLLCNVVRGRQLGCLCEKSRGVDVVADVACIQSEFTSGRVYFRGNCLVNLRVFNDPRPLASLGLADDPYRLCRARLAANLFMKKGLGCRV